jgi:hypothetical protein
VAISPLRRALNEALNNITKLEQGLALAVAPIDDADQLRELKRAKTSVLEAIDLEAEGHTRLAANDSCEDVPRRGPREGALFSKRLPRMRDGAAPIASWAAKTEPQIGDRIADGTVYAGSSPDTGKAMYATPGDAKLTYIFNQAQKYAAKLDAHGHQDWRVPTKGELNVLYNNRAAIGGFDESGSNSAGWYWSSSPYDKDFGWAQRFSDGTQIDTGRNFDSSLRCVRG